MTIFFVILVGFLVALPLFFSCRECEDTDTRHWFTSIKQGQVLFLGGKPAVVVKDCPINRYIKGKRYIIVELEQGQQQKLTQEEVCKLITL